MTRRIDNPDTPADIELRGYLDAESRSSFVMVAGAGSGKTTSLVKALDHLGKRHGKSLRRNGQQVACITYTEIATAEIWGDVGNIPLFHVSTIHSFLWSLVRPFQKEIASWVRLRIEEKMIALENERADFGPKVQQKTRDTNKRNTIRLAEQQRLIGGVRRFTYDSGSDYRRGILGHDDIIKMVPYLIMQYPLLAKIVARKYPYFFVDESQDTFPEVAKALKAVSKESPGLFCLGFFGDPMQKIYGHGVGDIEFDGDHQRITKPENFRCPRRVLSVINNIRASGDDLQQSRGRMHGTGEAAVPIDGRAKLFVLPADSHRTDNLNRVRKWMADSVSDSHWVSESKDADVRILVIVHRMAAMRLGFPDLYAAFNDGAPDSFGTAFREGTGWALKPFLEVILPLTASYSNGRDFQVMALLRDFCPRVQTSVLRTATSASQALSELKADLQSLSMLMLENGSATVLDVLRFAKQKALVILDNRFDAFLDPATTLSSSGSPTADSQDQDDINDADKLITAMAAYLTCPAVQVGRYFTYLMNGSPYSTQQGIKGAEFERVLVVLDDEEGRHRQYSYEKLFGLKKPSKSDLQNEADGKDTVCDRTRRLFYVCCSRATRDLAVVLYTPDVAKAHKHLRELALFEADDVLTLDMMRLPLH